jgi:hypothetical protein
MTKNTALYAQSAIIVALITHAGNALPNIHEINGKNVSKLSNILYVFIAILCAKISGVHRP